jgi:hypothetical protein
VPEATEWTFFGAATEIDDGFSASWADVSLALAWDLQETASEAIGFALSATQTNALRVSQANLAAALPAAFVLAGVEVEVRGRWMGASSGSRSVPLEAVVGGTLKKSLGSGSLPLSSTGVFTKGGPTDRMNLTESDVLDPNFGFRLWGASTTGDAAGNALRIDTVRVRVHWDESIAVKARGRGRSRLAFSRLLAAV